MSTTVFDGNTYANEAFADTYFSDRLPGNQLDTKWSAYEVLDRTGALYEATELLDEFQDLYGYKGVAVKVDQRHVFPRRNIINRNGGILAHANTAGTQDLIPIQLAEACCDIAIWLLEGNRTSEEYTETTGVGNISLRQNRVAKRRYPRWIISKLSFLFANDGRVRRSR